MLDSPAPGLNGIKAFIQKMTLLTRCIIIDFEICLKGTSAWVYWTRSLAVQLGSSILGTCSFLHTQFRNMTRLAISGDSGSNSLSECMRLILKPNCRYSLLTFLVPSSMFFTFRFLIIFTVENRICRDMVFRNPMPLMCMRLQHKVKLLYLSRITLGKSGNTIGSTF